MTFIDWVFALPLPLELQCKKTIQILEEELQMRYVTSFQRIGIQEGEGTLLIELLEHKFKKALPERYRKQIEQASPKKLINWGKRVLDSDVLEEVFI